MSIFHLRPFLVFNFLFVAITSFGQGLTISKSGELLTAFEDYSKCQTGFMRGKDTIYSAKFDDLSAVRVGTSSVVEETSTEIDFRYSMASSQESYRSYVRPNAWILSHNGKFGCLSNSGKWIIPCKYEDLRMNGHNFIALLNGKRGMINAGDTVLIPFKFDEIFNEGLSYNDNNDTLVRVVKDSLSGIYTDKGIELLPPRYQQIGRFPYHRVMELTFLLEQNKLKGLASGKGQIILEPIYESIEFLEDQYMHPRSTLFRVKDTLDRYAAFAADGRQLISFEQLNVVPVYSFETVNKERMAQFVERTDVSGRKQICSLTNGKSSGWYDGMTVIEDDIFAYSLKNESIQHWEILDSNLNVVYRNPETRNNLYYFDGYDEFQDIRSFPSYGNLKEMKTLAPGWKYRFGTSATPSVFVLMRRTLLMNEQDNQEKSNGDFSLFNSKTLVQTDFMYKDIQRFGPSGNVHFWCTRARNPWNRIDQKAAIDIYDGSAAFVQTIYLDESEQKTAKAYHGNHSAPWGAPVIIVKGGNGFSSVFHMSGDRLMTTSFEGKLSVFRFTNDTSYVFLGESSDKKIRFFNGRMEPYFDGMAFDVYTKYGEEIIRLGTKNKDKYMYTFLRSDFTLLLDSCAEPYNLDYKYASKLKHTTYRYMVTNRNGYMYVLMGDQFHLMDTSIFEGQERIHRVSEAVYVDEHGKITTEISEAKTWTAQFSEIYVTLTGGNLIVEDAQRKLIQTIPNVVGYKDMESYSRDNIHYILVNTTGSKQGLLNTKTGQWVVKPQYKVVDYTIRNGTTLYWAKGTEPDTARWMAIKEDGIPLTQPVFDQPFTFFDDGNWTYCIVDDKYGIVNRELQVVSDPIFEYVIQLDRKIILATNDRHYYLMDQSTGKSFLLKYDVVTMNFPKGHLLLSMFPDSVEIVALNGEQLLPSSKKADIMSTVNLIKYLYGIDSTKTLPYIYMNQLFVAEEDSALVCKSNQILLDNVSGHILPLRDIQEHIDYSHQNSQRCWINPSWINQFAYSEKITGDCYNQPVLSGLNRQEFSFRNYAIEPAGLVELKLADLFNENVDWTTQLDKLIEAEIQATQVFGTNCADMPGAIAEFKRNFYLERGYLTFFYYPIQRTIRIPITKMNTLLEHPEYF